MSGSPSILYLVTSSGWGGAERYVARLAHAAVRHFGEVHVVAGPGDGTLFDHLPHQAYVLRSDRIRRRISPFTDLMAARELRAYLRKNRIDIIHANSTKAGLLAAMALRGLKRPPRHVYTAHGWAFMETDRSPVFRTLTAWSERFAARTRDATIILSESERRIALERGLGSEETLHFIPHGIAPDAVNFLTRTEARKSLFSEESDDFVFGTIANAYPPKNLPGLIASFDRIAGDRPSIRLTLIGDGPSMPALRARHASSPYKDRIILAGRRPEAARLLKAFDTFVLPSTKEGMPWCILEASLAGVPVVATKVGAIPETLRDGESALLVEPGDVSALADAMARMHDDTDLRTRIANGIPRVAASRHEELMISRTFRVYQA